MSLPAASSGAFGYSRLQHKIVFTHAEAPPAHEGQGIGSAIVGSALAAARERRLEVILI
ncbi:MAG: GNAT family N-acetyltransferase [Sphingomicrobium sp.]